MKRVDIAVMALIAALLLALEIAIRSHLLSAQLLPAPSQVVAKIIDIIQNGEIVAQIYYSLKTLLIALFVTVFVVIAMALLASRYVLFHRLFDLLASVLNPIPSVAVLPLFLLWFGIGQTTLIATLLHSTVWSFYAILLNGLETMPKIYQTVADALKMNGLRRFIHLTAPACLAAFLTGLKTAWARAWRALIGVEMIFGTIAASSGLGWFIFKSRAFADAPAIVAGLVFIAAFGYLFEYVLFGIVERHTIKKWGIK